MTKLESIDRWLIEGPYQGLVDRSGKAPEWWVENAAIAMAVSAWVETALRGWSTQPFELFVTVVMSIFAALVIAGARVKNGLPRLLGSQLIRHMVLVLTAIGWLGVMLRAHPLAVLSFANAAAYLSIWYFTACKPPSNRKRKHMRLATVLSQ